MVGALSVVKWMVNYAPPRPKFFGRCLPGKFNRNLLRFPSASIIPAKILHQLQVVFLMRT